MHKKSDELMKPLARMNLKALIYSNLKGIE
jgi:hypothetical protein